ncbi:polycystic kidney disease protein 1-like 2 [Elysia marginata]|uniref:Polycystic kidney disease protein 1-like 2 n=1 Tax=Elysia marginata TaxID=1093978 RepID=A0AAV4I5C6_9GAST|nr:polycystic kidney disease protein 1-like 2 [Elysia marginata]
MSPNETAVAVQYSSSRIDAELYVSRATVVETLITYNLTNTQVIRRDNFVNFMVTISDEILHKYQGMRGIGTVDLYTETKTTRQAIELHVNKTPIVINFKKDRPLKGMKFDIYVEEDHGEVVDSSCVIFEARQSRLYNVTVSLEITGSYNYSFTRIISETSDQILQLPFVTPAQIGNETAIELPKLTKEYELEHPNTVHYFLVRVPTVNRTDYNSSTLTVRKEEVKVTAYRSKCLYLKDKHWRSDAKCLSIPNEEIRLVKCHCYVHSPFSAVLYDARENLRTFKTPSFESKGQNLVPGFIVLILIMLTMYYCYWAFFQDIREKECAQIHAIKDCYKFESPEQYLVCISTGMMPGSGTTNRVSFLLVGQSGSCQMVMPDGDFCFSTGSDIWFLMSSDLPVGPITGVTVNYDKVVAGTVLTPWFLKRVIVYSKRFNHVIKLDPMRTLGINLPSLVLPTVPVKKKWKREVLLRYWRIIKVYHTVGSVLFHVPGKGANKCQSALASLVVIMTSLMLALETIGGPRPLSHLNIHPDRWAKKNFFIDVLHLGAIICCTSLAIKGVYALVFRKQIRVIWYNKAIPRPDEETNQENSEGRKLPETWLSNKSPLPAPVVEEQELATFDSSPSPRYDSTELDLEYVRWRREQGYQHMSPSTERSLDQSRYYDPHTWRNSLNSVSTVTREEAVYAGYRLQRDRDRSFSIDWSQTPYNDHDREPSNYVPFKRIDGENRRGTLSSLAEYEYPNFNVNRKLSDPHMKANGLIDREKPGSHALDLPHDNLFEPGSQHSIFGHPFVHRTGCPYAQKENFAVEGSIGVNFGDPNTVKTKGCLTKHQNKKGKHIHLNRADDAHSSLLSSNTAVTRPTPCLLTDRSSSHLFGMKQEIPPPISVDHSALNLPMYRSMVPYHGHPVKLQKCLLKNKQNSISLQHLEPEEASTPKFKDPSKVEKLLHFRKLYLNRSEELRSYTKLCQKGRTRHASPMLLQSAICRGTSSSSLKPRVSFNNTSVPQALIPCLSSLTGLKCKPKDSRLWRKRRTLTTVSDNQEASEDKNSSAMPQPENFSPYYETEYEYMPADMQYLPYMYENQEDLPTVAYRDPEIAADDLSSEVDPQMPKSPEEMSQEESTSENEPKNYFRECLLILKTLGSLKSYLVKIPLIAGSICFIVFSTGWILLHGLYYSIQISMTWLLLAVCALLLDLIVLEPAVCLCCAVISCQLWKRPQIINECMNRFKVVLEEIDHRYWVVEMGWAARHITTFIHNQAAPESASLFHLHNKVYKALKKAVRLPNVVFDFGVYWLILYAACILVLLNLQQDMFLTNSQSTYLYNALGLSEKWRPTTVDKMWDFLENNLRPKLGNMEAPLNLSHATDKEYNVTRGIMSEMLVSPIRIKQIRVQPPIAVGSTKKCSHLPAARIDQDRQCNFEFTREKMETGNFVHSWRYRAVRISGDHYQHAEDDTTIFSMFDLMPTSG